MILLKQSTARNIVLKVFSSSDHVTAATGKTLTVTLSKDGGAFAALGGTVSEISSGWYKVALSATDTNTLGQLAIRATASGCDDSEKVLSVVAFDPQSATNLGLSQIDAAISSRMATFSYTAPPAVTAIRTEMDSNSTKLANLDAAVSSRLATAGYTAPSTPPTVTQIRTEMDSNSAKLANLDAAVSSRMATFSYTAPPTADENADALLKRDWTAVTGEAARSVLNALRAIRNKVSRSGATLTITKEDDATSAWTAALTTDAAAEPVTGVDPA